MSDNKRKCCYNCDNYNGCLIRACPVSLLYCDNFTPKKQTKAVKLFAYLDKSVISGGYIGNIVYAPHEEGRHDLIRVPEFDKDITIEV
jgi:hypothetical protein